jgi:hypothetical protein
MTDLEAWWNQLPRVTKWLFTGSFGLTIAANLLYQIIPFFHPYNLILDFDLIFSKFQIWRLVTAFLYHGRLGFPFLIHMLFLVRYGASLEKDTFLNRTADFLWMVIFSCILLLIPGFFLDLKILGMPLIMTLIYYWSRKNQDVIMSFIFGLRFKAVYFPWVLLTFNLLLGAPVLAEILGILVGHIYFFLQDVYPQHRGGRPLLTTPQFLLEYFPPPRTGFPAPGNVPPPRQPGYNWGRGQRLGGN